MRHEQDQRELMNSRQHLATFEEKIRHNKETLADLMNEMHGYEEGAWEFRKNYESYKKDAGRIREMEASRQTELDKLYQESRAFGETIKNKEKECAEAKAHLDAERRAQAQSAASAAQEIARLQQEVAQLNEALEARIAQSATEKEAAQQAVEQAQATLAQARDQAERDMSEQRRIWQDAAERSELQMEELRDTLASQSVEIKDLKKEAALAHNMGEELTGRLQRDLKSATDANDATQRALEELKAEVESERLRASLDNAAQASELARSRADCEIACERAVVSQRALAELQAALDDAQRLCTRHEAAASAMQEALADEQRRAAGETTRADELLQRTEMRAREAEAALQQQKKQHEQEMVAMRATLASATAMARKATPPLPPPAAPKRTPPPPMPKTPPKDRKRQLPLPQQKPTPQAAQGSEESVQSFARHVTTKMKSTAQKKQKRKPATTAANSRSKLATRNADYDDMDGPFSSE